MTLLEYARGTNLTWAEVELAAERLLESIAKRHAAGSGGPCGAEDAEIDGQALVLPVFGQAGSDADVTQASGQALWEFLVNRPWSDAEGDPDRDAGDWVRQRWPGCTPAHLKVLDRALSNRPPRPEALLRLWREAREQAGAALQPLRLRNSASRDAATTGLFPPQASAKWAGADPSVFDDRPAQSNSQLGVWIVVGVISALLLIGVCAAGFSVLGLFG